MSKITDQVKALIERAFHKGTSIEEARTSAIIAIRLIVKHDLQIIDKKEPEFESIHENDPWDEILNNPNWADKKEWNTVTTFRAVQAKSKGVCKACGGVFNKDEVIANAGPDKGITHYRCRGYWLGVIG